MESHQSVSRGERECNDVAVESGSVDRQAPRGRWRLESDLPAGSLISEIPKGLFQGTLSVFFSELYWNSTLSLITFPWYTVARAHACFHRAEAEKLVEQGYLLACC